MSSPKESSLTLINNALSGVFFIIKSYYNVLNLTFIFSPCCNTVGYPDCKTTLIEVLLIDRLMHVVN